MLPLLCSMLLFFPNFALKSIIFPPILAMGLFPLNCWKKPSEHPSVLSFLLLTIATKLVIYNASCLQDDTDEQTPLHFGKFLYCTQSTENVLKF